MKALRLSLAAVIAAASTPALADPYNFTFTSSAGAVLGTGQLSTDGSVNPIPCSTACTGSTVVSMTGSFLGQPLSIVLNPYPPATFQSGRFIGDNQLISGLSVQLDNGGLIVSAGTLGTGNILGDEAPLDPAGSHYLTIFGATAASNAVYFGTFVATAAAATTTATGGSQGMPVVLGSMVTNIGGQIGPTNAEQFYSFYWGGGAFSSTASITGAAAGDTFSFLLLGAGTMSATLNSANYFVNSISANLTAGRYTIGLLGLVQSSSASLTLPDAIQANSTFGISFAAPVSGTQATAVPEPGSWALMVAGFAAVGLMMRRCRVTLVPG